MADTTRVSTGIAVLMPEIWAKEVGLRATGRRILAAACERFDASGPGDVYNFQQIADISATQITTGNPLTSTSITYTEVTNPRQRVAEPLAAYAAIQIQRDLATRMLDAAAGAMQQRLGISVANRVEVAIAGLLDIANTPTGGGWSNTDVGTTIAPWSVDNFLAAIGTVWHGGQDLVTPGSEKLYAFYDTAHWDNIFTAGFAGGLILSAATRGEANGPARTGRLESVFGVDIQVTGHMTDTQGHIFAEGAVVLLMKEEPLVVIQDFDLNKKIIAYVDYAPLVLWPELGVGHLHN